VVELRVVDTLTLGSQELDELGATVGLGRSEDVRQVGAEALVFGQRALLQQLAAVAGSPDADGLQRGRRRV
jgi:hypothetical protein